MIDLSYVRPKKSEALRKWYDKEFIKKAKLEVINLQNAMILPLKRFPEDNLQFGRGGVVDAEGNYAALSGLRNRIWGVILFQKSSIGMKKLSTAAISLINGAIFWLRQSRGCGIG